MNGSESIRDEVLVAAAAADWRRILEFVEGVDELIEGHPELARAVGLAAAAVGCCPFDPDMLRKAIKYLSVAWYQGSRGPEVTWPLVRAQYDLGLLVEADSLLTAYIDETEDPNERVRAGGFLGQVKEVCQDYRAAVAAHQASLAGLGRTADETVRLDSYLNAHLARAYGRAGHSLKWTAGAMACWETLADADRTADRSLGLLRGADLSSGDGGDLRPAIALGEHLIQLFDPPGAQTSPGAWASLGELRIELFGLYHRAGLHEKATAMLASARTMIEELRQSCDRHTGEATDLDGILRLLLHNLGYQCRQAGRPHDALALMREVEQVPPVIGPTYFFLAALTLETGGDKRDSLAYLRRSAEDRYWVTDGACCSLRSAFFSDPAFEQVREAPEFLAIVEALSDSTKDCD